MGIRWRVTGVTPAVTTLVRVTTDIIGRIASRRVMPVTRVTSEIGWIFIRVIGQIVLVFLVGVVEGIGLPSPLFQICPTAIPILIFPEPSPLRRPLHCRNILKLIFRPRHL